MSDTNTAAPLEQETKQELDPPMDELSPEEEELWPENEDEDEDENEDEDEDEDDELWPEDEDDEELSAEEKEYEREDRRSAIRCVIEDALHDDYRAHRKSHGKNGDLGYPPDSLFVHGADQDPKRNTGLVPEVVFEPIDPGHPGVAERHARELIGRGARRVVGILLDSDELVEWSPSEGAWAALDHDRPFEDPTFARPMPIAKLVRPSKREAAHAFDRNRRRYVRRKLAEWEKQKAFEEFHDRWEDRWKTACIGVLDELCAELGITVEPLHRERIEELPPSELQRLFGHVLHERELTPMVTTWTDDDLYEHLYEHRPWPRW